MEVTMRFRGFKRNPSTSCTHLGVSSYIIAWNFLFTLILQNILFIKYQPNNLQAKMINEILGTVVLCASAFELTLSKYYAYSFLSQNEQLKYSTQTGGRDSTDYCRLGKSHFTSALQLDA